MELQGLLHESLGPGLLYKDPSEEMNASGENFEGGFEAGARFDKMKGHEVA